MNRKEFACQKDVYSAGVSSALSNIPFFCS